jgi:hypothetical protein
VKAYKVTVGHEAVVNLVPRDDISRPVYLQIEGNSTVYIGGPNVTAADGFPIVKHAAPIQGGLPAGDGLWAICAPGTTEVIRIITVDAD